VQSCQGITYLESRYVASPTMIPKSQPKPPNKLAQNSMTILRSSGTKQPYTAPPDTPKIKKIRPHRTIGVIGFLVVGSLMAVSLACVFDRETRHNSYFVLRTVPSANIFAIVFRWTPNTADFEFHQPPGESASHPAAQSLLSGEGRLIVIEPPTTASNSLSRRPDDCQTFRWKPARARDAGPVQRRYRS